MVVPTLLAFCVTFPAKPKEERKALYLSVLSSDIILVELTMSLEGSEEKSRHLLEVSHLVLRESPAYGGPFHFPPSSHSV